MPPGSAPEEIGFFAGDSMKLNLSHYPPSGDAPLGPIVQMPVHGIKSSALMAFAIDPSRTIAALAERACALMIGERR